MESFVLPSMAYVCMRDGKLCIAIHGIGVYESEASPHRGVGWKALYCHPWHMCV